MKKLLLIPILFLLLFMTTVRKRTIIFFGDSITQMGTNKAGYIDVMQNSIYQKGIQSKYDISGSGVGYNKIYDLYLRMDDDLLAKKPNEVVVYIGINDVGHKYSTKTGTDLDKFEIFYVAIIKKLQAKKIKVFICTPTLLGEKKDLANLQDAELNEYSNVIRKLATSYNCTLIDLRKIFLDYIQANNKDDVQKGLLTVDGIHPSELGNKLLADEMMKALAIY